MQKKHKADGNPILSMKKLLILISIITIYSCGGDRFDRKGNVTFIVTANVNGQLDPCG